MSSDGRLTLAEFLDRTAVERLELGPGDILVLKTPGPLTVDESEALREQCTAALPTTPVLILDNADASVLRAHP